MTVRLYVGGAALTIGLMASPAVAQDRLVHHEIDRNTNAVIRVFKTTGGGRIEVETPELKVTKTVMGSRVVTRMSERADELVVTTDPKAVAVSSKAGHLTASRSDRAKLERVRVLVAGSSAGRHAAELIGRLGFGSATPIQPVLLTTRAFLLAATGDGGSSRELSRWAREARERLSPAVPVLKVGWQDKVSKGMTPTDCWDAYAKEAIAAYIEYEDCVKNLKWWQVLAELECATVYDMRALGAFTWWLHCVSLS